MPNVDEILGGAQDKMSVRSVFGEPIEADGVIVVPVAKIGGGGGGGGDSENNGGGGFGLAAWPAGAYVIKDAEVTWKPAIDVNRLAAFGFLLGLVFALKR